MTNITISDLPSLSTMTDSAVIPVDTGANTYQISGANLKNYFGSASLISNGTSYANIVSSNGNVVISSNSNEWTFDTDGNLTFPTGNLVITSDDPDGNTASIVSTDHSLVILSTGANGAVATVWVEDYANVGASNIAAVYANPTPESKIVRIAVGQNGSPGPNLWDFNADGNLTFPDSSVQTTAYTGGGGSSIPAVVTTGAAGISGQAHVKVQFTVASDTTVTAVGVTAIGVSNPTSGRITLDATPDTGSFNMVVATNVAGQTFILTPFATNASGTGYGAPILGTGTDPCLVKGTMITMADMSRVAVENISYDDNILVWDFDNGVFTSAKPLWIKKAQTSVVSCLLTFSDYSELRIVGESPKAHRIFNKEAGKFTYGSMPETPIGTTTFNDKGEEITLISKEWIVGEVEFYNVITDYHMNLFANSILTSMRYNNVYHINDMKFVKDDRTLRTANDYPNIEERLYRGFRLAEQTQSIEDIETHIQWLLTLEVEREIEYI